MSQFAIDAHQLSKRFRLGGPKERYTTLSGSISRWFRSPLASIRSALRSRPTYWALRDVSFQVTPGEVVGVIGRNGAGKSTLLKILARILEPTDGYVDVRGRVGSLLEVGAGFHTELTGRENIYLSGAILGMLGHEIDRRFDEIVAFAEVEQFVDTPVKRYSTGMYLRLAFAVAAHLETEILLVDEVLAVGDASFQKKCLMRLGDVAHRGRTVLFVSHNMGAVRNLCQRGIVLEEGRIASQGEIAGCIEAYYRSIGALAADGENGGRQSTFGPIHVRGRDNNSIHQSEAFALCTDLDVESHVAGFLLTCRLEDMHGRLLCQKTAASSELGFVQTGQRQRWPVSVQFPAMWLNPGLYSVEFSIVYSGEFEGGDSAVSDKFPLDVRGDHGTVDRRTGTAPILNPSVEWSGNDFEFSSRLTDSDGEP